MHLICEEKLNRLISRRTNAFIEEGKLGCAEIIVNQNGKRVFHECFGTDPETNALLKPRSLYRAASMTKPITTVAFLKLADAGLVDLNAPVSRYLPQYAYMKLGHLNEEHAAVTDGPAEKPLLVYQLFCHVNGIGVPPMCEYVRPAWKSTRDTCDFYSAQPLAFEPDTAQCYSPTAAFDVAARIIELITGTPFAEYVKTSVTEPVGMCDTTYRPDPAQWQRIVGMHARSEQGVSMPGATTQGCVFSSIPPEACAAGAGMLTSAEDYSAFAEMLLNHGTGRNGAYILSPAAVQNLSTPHVSEEIMNCDERWGLGVRVITRPSYPHGLAVGSFGWSGAYGSHFWVDPVNNISAVYMKNSLYDGGAGCNTANCFEEDVTESLL